MSAPESLPTNAVDTAPEVGVANRNAREIERERVIAGLREFADFLDAHPTVEASEQRFLIYVTTREKLVAYARLTSWEKVYDQGAYFMLRKTFGSGAVLEVYTDRDNVCRKIVKGTRIVPARPATEESIEEIVEWECDDASLLGGAR